jgi:hypothetical protein
MAVWLIKGGGYGFAHFLAPKLTNFIHSSIHSFIHSSTIPQVGQLRLPGHGSGYLTG